MTSILTCDKNVDTRMTRYAYPHSPLLATWTYPYATLKCISKRRINTTTRYKGHRWRTRGDCCAHSTGISSPKPSCNWVCLTETPSNILDISLDICTPVCMPSYPGDGGTKSAWAKGELVEGLGPVWPWPVAKPAIVSAALEWGSSASPSRGATSRND